MAIKIRTIIKNILPAGLIKLYRWRPARFGYFGAYQKWSEAQNKSRGYHDDQIFAKIIDAALQVKNGQALYERDSVVFDKIQYFWPTLACLLFIASKNNNHLQVLDFGGSLGSTYYQNYGFLKHLDNFTWSIIEQDKLVDFGRSNLESGSLKFYYNLAEFFGNGPASVVLFSSSLQYLENPWEILADTFKYRPPYILLDRLVVNQNKTIVTVQKVPPEIYPAVYPVWVFNESEIMDFFAKNNYELVVDFEAFGGEVIIQKTLMSGEHRGYLFQLKK